PVLGEIASTSLILASCLLTRYPQVAAYISVQKPLLIGEIKEMNSAASSLDVPLKEGTGHRDIEMFCPRRYIYRVANSAKARDKLRIRKRCNSRVDFSLKPCSKASFIFHQTVIRQ